MSIVVGTVGWEDEETYFEVGSNQNDGYTLVRVQLFGSRDMTKPLKPGVGQGMKILCHIGSGVYRVPPVGTRVYVAVPDGMESNPGAGVIFATVEKNPLAQYNSDRVQMNFGDDVDVVIRAKSVTMMDPGGRFITVGTPRGGGTPGIILQDETGSGGTITNGAVGWWSATGGEAKSLIQVTTTEISLQQKDGAFLTLGGGDAYLVGQNSYVMGSGVYLGHAPTAATTALYGVSGPAGIASTSVFLSP